MKNIVFFTALLIINSAFSQSINFLEGNNVRGLIADDGVFFQHQGTSSASYEFPAGSNKFAIFSMAYWMGGKDPMAQLHLAANQYGQDEDFFAGPISSDYNSTYYQNNFLSSIWPMSKEAVDFHIANYNNVGYMASQNILDWPGNGNLAEGVAAQLAPYADVNNNQIYDPLNGDYPYILGDFAVYTIMNDAAGIHTQSGGEALGVEVHSMYYQYTTNDDLNNTTFLHLKIHNRSSDDYSDFLYGVWMDPDVGDYSNDFAGCDSTRNLGYAYNALPTDNGGPGQDSYGLQVPAVGAVFLNNPMYKYVFGTSGTPGNMNTAADYYNFLDGYWTDGTPFTYGGSGHGGTVPTNFCYSGNPADGSGWSEVSEINTEGDRRFLMSTYVGDLSANSERCLDLAIVINNDSSDYLQNVENLFVTTDFIQAFYDSDIQPCDQIFVSTADNSQAIKVEVYPNPASSSVYVNVGQSFDYAIYDMKGSVILSNKIIDGGTLLNLDLETGVYLLQVKTEDGVSTTKLEIN